jgi:hypothetical protein
MERPTEDEVRIALMVTRPGADIGPNVACVLKAELEWYRERERHVASLIDSADGCDRCFEYARRVCEATT